MHLNLVVSFSMVYTCITSYTKNTRGHDMGKTVSIRLPDDISQELDKVSREINRNKSFIIKSAIEKYLDEYADYQIALDRLRNKDDEIISVDEMRGLFGI